VKFLSDLWCRTPTWLVAFIVTAGSATFLAATYGENIRGLFHRGIEIPPGEYAQLQEDKRHAGKVPKFLMVDDKVAVSYYEPGCIRVEHLIGDRNVRSWSPSPLEFAPVPEHEGHYGSTRGAGIIGQSCAPYDYCWQPVLDHPGIQGSQQYNMDRPTEDRCWFWRPLETPDGCRWEIPVSYCTGEWSWSHAQWTCCKGAHA
jgi:hypothetical protein